MQRIFCCHLPGSGLQGRAGQGGGCTAIGPSHGRDGPLQDGLRRDHRLLPADPYKEVWRHPELGDIGCPGAGGLLRRNDRSEQKHRGDVCRGFGKLCGLGAGDRVYIFPADPQPAFGDKNVLQHLDVAGRTALLRHDRFSLGNMDPVLNTPYVVVLALTAILAVLALKKPGENVWMGALSRAWIWFLSLTCLSALMFSMLLAWTPVTASMIQGVQGRYLLPLLPMILLTVKNDRVVRTGWNDGYLLYVMTALDVYVILRIFAVVCLRVS